MKNSSRIKIVLLAVAALALPAITFAAPGQKAKSPKPLPGRISFFAGDPYGEGSELWICSPDGLNKKELVGKEANDDPDGRADVRSPAVWNSTGRRLAWIHGYDLRSFDLSTGKESVIPLPKTKSQDGPGLLNPSGTPAWDQSGKWILTGGLISQEADSDGGLWQISVEGKPPRMLFPAVDADGAMYDNPKLSQNGRYLAAGSSMDESGVFQVYDWQNQHPLKRGNIPDRILSYLTDFVLLPNNKSALLSCNTIFFNEKPGPGGIWKWDIRTGKIRRFLEKGREVNQLELSPDGKLLIYMANIVRGVYRLSNLKQICVYNMATGTSRILVKSIYIDYLDTISWAPDSRHFVFSGTPEGGGRHHIWMVDALTEEKKLIIEHGWRPVWSPR